MSKVITDFAKLNKAMLTPVERPKESPAAVIEDDGREAMECFARQDEVDEDAVSEADVYKTALEDLAGEKAGVEAQLGDAEKGLAAARRRISELEREVERLTGDNARLRGEAAKRETEADEVDAAEPLPAVEVPRKGLLDRPFGFEEMFTDEIREILIASLADYRKNIENGGYARRAAVLDAVLAANGSSGELEARSTKLRQILKDAGYFNNPKPLEKLGIKLIDGRKHWKLEYAGIRITLAKTPSDHCSNSNSAADIARRCF